MNALTDDQLARIRFAWRLYSRGLSYGGGVPESAIDDANKIIGQVIRAAGGGGAIASAEFTRIAKKVISSTE